MLGAHIEGLFPFSLHVIFRLVGDTQPVCQYRVDLTQSKSKILEKMKCTYITGCLQHTSGTEVK